MKTIWILVHVHHGLIQQPEVFLTEEKAISKKKFIESDGFNVDYDEVEIFKKAF